jgi:hypothetical protein
MTNPTLTIGEGNWAVKEDFLLGWKINEELNKYIPREMGVTRASDGFALDSEGLLRRYPWNLVQQSEAFDTTNWSKGNIVVSPNSTIAPDGKLTADKIFPASSGSVRNIIQNTGNSLSNHTGSIYAKWDGGTIPVLGITYGSSPNIVFNLQTQQILTTAGITATMASVGNGWYRCVWNYVSTTDTRFYMFLTNTTTLNFNVTANGNDGIFIWGAQVVESNNPLTYFRTTDRQDVIRIDSSKGEKGVLIEPQRSNVQVASNTFSNAVWTKSNLTITDNTLETLSPVGINNASLLTSTSNSNQLSDFNTLADGVVTGSFFVKNKNSVSVKIGMSNGTTGDTAATFVFATQSFNVDSTAPAWSNTTVKSENYGNGWYRLSITSTKSGSTQCSIYLSTIENTKSIYAFGAQLEAGSYASSYIVNNNTTQNIIVTRNGDNLIYTNAGHLFGETEGTIFLEFYHSVVSNAGFRVLFSTEASTANQFNNLLLGTQNNGNDLQYSITAAGVSQGSVSSSNLTEGKHRIIIQYSLLSNGCKFYLDGSLVGSFTATSLPLINRFSLMSRINSFASFNADRQYGSVLTKCQLFNNYLSESECLTKTSL